jgi:flagellar biosynthesis protein FliQ
MVRLAEQRRILNALTSQNREEFVRRLRQAVEQDAAKSLMDQLGEVAKKEIIFSRWEKFSTEALRRLDDEIAAQGRRGTLNMVLGVLTALAGVSLLAWMVLREPPHTTSINEFLLSFIPRISIVAIIEVFAYFFLRLYKAGLAEIKYFQNEATNLESRLAALRITLDFKNPELTTQVVLKLLSVERNPLLQKDVSTLELERERLDATPVALSVSQVAAIVEKVLVAKGADKSTDKGG